MHSSVITSMISKILSIWKKLSDLTQAESWVESLVESWVESLVESLVES